MNIVNISKETKRAVMNRILDFDFKIFSWNIQSVNSSAGSIIDIIKYGSNFKEDFNVIYQLKNKLEDVDYSLLSFKQYKDLIEAYTNLSNCSQVDISFQKNLMQSNSENFFSMKQPIDENYRNLNFLYK